jgi:hypothetical protein
MSTLDKWREFAATPRTLKFPRLELIGYDGTPPIVVGLGEVQMATPDRLTFTLTGVPSDLSYAMAEVRRERDDRYSGHARFRLVGIDVEGTEWRGIVIEPRLQVTTSWTFAGEINGLDTIDCSETVSTQPGVEAIFLLRVGDPMALHLARYVRTRGQIGRPLKREFSVEVLGSQISFIYDGDLLRVYATESADLCRPYAANWLAEPLRILFGQLIYPRLVAANLGNGRAFVSVRRSPGLIPGARWVALWGKEEPDWHDDDAFWQCYRDILSLIARACTKEGDKNFEANDLTRLYEECIQASRGSRWIWALTFASGVEGLLKTIARQDASLSNAAEPSSNEVAQIQSLAEHIASWRGDDRLKQIAERAVRRVGEISATRLLRALEAEGVITSEQSSAWRAVRHPVMHGTFISPYSTEEGDEQLLSLAAMMHTLTRELLRRSRPTVRDHTLSA